MRTLDNPKFFFVVFIVVSLTIIGAFWWRATLPEPKIDNIVCDEQTIVDQLDNCIFETLRSDTDDNIYLFLRNLKSDNSYVVKMNKEGRQISWFKIPYMASMFFYLSPVEQDMVFYISRSDKTFQYSKTGDLVKTTTLEDLGLDIDMVTEDPREATLSNGVKIKISFEKGKYQLIATKQDGSRVTLIKQTD